LEGAWWLGEIAGDAAISRLQLLKRLCKPKRRFQGIVFVTKDGVDQPIGVKQPDGTVQVDVRPRIIVPRDSEEWNEVSCAAAFEMLARSPSFEHYPEISPGLDFIELTRDEFVKWLLVRGFEIPTFWGRGGETTPLRQAPPNLIEKAISDVYDLADASGAKPPNIKELVKPVQDLLKAKGLKASGRQIQDTGGGPKFKGRRGKIGTTLKKEGRARSS
jgi:hypothetical protein